MFTLCRLPAVLLALSTLLFTSLSVAATKAEFNNNEGGGPLYWTPQGNLSLSNTCHSMRLWGFWPSFTCSEAHALIPAGVKVDFPSLQQARSQPHSSPALHQHLLSSQPAVLRLAAAERTEWRAYELPGYAEQATAWLARQQQHWQAQTDAARLNLILSASLLLALLALATGAYVWLRQPR